MKQNEQIEGIRYNAAEAADILANALANVASVETTIPLEGGKVEIVWEPESKLKVLEGMAAVYADLKLIEKIANELQTTKD